MNEHPFDELKRYMRFGPQDEAALRAFAPSLAPHAAGIIDAFYARIDEHEEARRVVRDDAQLQRLKVSLREWLDLMFAGPWDHAYHERRSRIGHVHVQIGLPQRYMFAAIDMVRVQLIDRVFASALAPDARHTLLAAIHKILDLELAIMLESYRQAFVDEVQRLERIERDELARRLALSEARHDEIVEKAEALITTTDSSGSLTLFNGKCESVTGLTREEVIGSDWLEIFVPEQERERVRALQRAVLAGRPGAPYEGSVYTASGTRRVRWHFTTLPGGSAPALCAIGIEVTNEHELSVRTRRAERLAALGTMAAGLAHEIRNPLNAAHLQLNVARRRLTKIAGGAGEGPLKAVELAGAEIQRLAALVEDFLQFARPQPLRLAPFDLRAMAEAIVSLLEPEARAVGVGLKLAAGPRVELEFDHEKMKQVLINLLRNALEAAAPGGQVLVRVGATEDKATLAVEDTGPGIPADMPIFEPFFTTKEKGTGLGLAIVHRIVMDHGGNVDAQSRPGRTVFSITLPFAGHDPALLG